MTPKQYVERVCQLNGFDLHKPTPKAKDILVMSWRTGKGVVLVDARDWKDAAEQIREVVNPSA